jgi:hypothetical protein
LAILKVKILLGMNSFKWIVCFSILVFFFSCKSDKDSAKKELTDSSEKIEQSNLWVNYAGDSDMPKIVLVSGDEEYRSEEALPQLAKILTEHHGFNTQVLFAQDPKSPGIINANYLHNIPGLESLDDADLMVIFTRFRALPDDQMAHIDNYLKAGKPVIGIRTATHAFNFKDSTATNYMHYGNYYKGDDVWKDGFGRLVLGENWISHHGHHKHQSTRGVPAPGSESHPILSGINEGDVWAPSDVYGIRSPLPRDGQAILLGQVINRKGEYDENDPLYGMRPTDDEVATKNPANKKNNINPNDPMMPIAWTKSYQLPDGKEGQAFTSTVGASTDLLSEGVRRMYVNAVFHLLGKSVPPKANVNFVGEYNPSAFAFTKEGFWEEKNMSVASLRR